MTKEQREIRYVCFKTPDKVYGIDICDLVSTPEEEKTVVHWDSLSPIPAAFKADLPAFCTPLVELDSNFYLLGGFQHPRNGRSRFGPPSIKVFQLQLEEAKDNNQKHLTCKESSSIPKPPRPYGKTPTGYVNIRGDYYFIGFGPNIPIQIPDFFWVLRSSTRDWECLPSPPELGVTFLDVLETQYFVFGEKIFFQTICGGKEEAQDESSSGEPIERVIFYSFDPFMGLGTWTILGETNEFIESFSFHVEGRRRFHRPSITLPVPGLRDLSLLLSDSHIETSDLFVFDAWKNGYKATLHALLVNQRGVRVVQPIEGCFEGIQPTFRCAHPALLYLGNNMICAMLVGFATEHYYCTYPLVAISVFHLSIMEDAIDMDHLNSFDPPKVQNFLTVKVKSKHVYSMEDYLKYYMYEEQFYPFLDEIKGFLWVELRELIDPLSPPSKRPKI
ncbi:hypothetical protein PIB30_030170 [Stylosanthes scabra]|uniref:Uncharacterized protein n=1 Tax=Stylosanthes scabra TaxID=79078 RepID=A0ABU6RBR1_9FABA|nr:hypothetical protein [Stylosanthes scabra]